MRQLKRTEYQSVHTTDEINITFGHAGTIGLNPNLVKLLDLSHGDRVIITSDEVNDYYIGKAKDPADPEGFVVRDANKTGKKHMSFNASGVVKEIREKHDLALAKEKKKSIRFTVSKTPTEWNGISLHQIDLS